MKHPVKGSIKPVLCKIYNFDSNSNPPKLTKLHSTVRAIAAVENPADVYVISSRQYGQRAVLKTARYIGATPIAGRYTPGAFTNQIQASVQGDSSALRPGLG